MVRKLKYVSVPLNISYEHSINRWFLSIGAGMQFNMLTSTSGTFYNPETDKIESFRANDILNPVVYVARASVGIGYNFTPNWSAVVQPHIVSSLNTQFKESSEYATKFQGYGANLKLRYSF